MATTLGRDVVVQLLQGFQELKLEVQDLKVRVSKLEGRMDKLEGRMDKLEGRMDKLEGRMDKLEGRMGRLEGRMDKLEGRMDKLEASNALILDYVKRIAAMLIELPSHGRGYDELLERVADHERRITALEH